MNSTNRLIVGAAVLSLAATAGITALTQAATPAESDHVRGEHLDAVHQALENNDYTAWSEALANHPKAEEFVSEETFAKLQEAHALVEAGDREGARALLDEAGIRPLRRDHREDFRERRPRGGENRVAMKEAMEAGDYEAWAELLADHPNAEEFVNEETFAMLQEAHALMEAGDKEGAKVLLEEAGIHPPKRGRK